MANGYGARTVELSDEDAREAIETLFMSGAWLGDDDLAVRLQTMVGMTVDEIENAIVHDTQNGGWRWRTDFDEEATEDERQDQQDPTVPGGDADDTTNTDDANAAD